MIVAKPYHRNPPRRPGALPLAEPLVERVRHYFARHPEVRQEEFLLEAVGRELRFCEQREAKRGAARQPRSAAGIHVQAAVAERLAVIHYERHALWPRVRRFLAGLLFTPTACGCRHNKAAFRFACRRKGIPPSARQRRFARA